MKTVILGAHTAVGRALANLLEERELEGEVVRATTAEHLDPSTVLVEGSTLGGAQVMFLAFEGELADGLVAGASRLSAPLVDLVGILPRSVPLVFPQLDPDLGRRLEGAGLLRVPLGLAGGIAATLRALSPFGPRVLRVVTFEGAGGMGEPGMEELSEQTRGIFSQREVEPRVFPAPVAFGVLGSVGGPTDLLGPDADLEADVSAALDRPLEVRAFRTRAPIFTGEGAALDVSLEDVPSLEMLEDTLASARGLRASRAEIPGTLEVVDRDDVTFARVRRRSDGIDLWLAADRLRQGAALQGALVAEALGDRARGPQ